MIKCLLLLSALLRFSPLAAEFEILTFQQLAGKENAKDLKLLNGKKVRMMGFLYSSEKGTLFLAGEPNLKSCCIGNPQLHQIALPGFFPPLSGNALLLEGTFLINNAENADSLYTLQNAVIVTSSRNSGQGVLLAFMIAIPLSAVILLLYKRHRSAA